MGVKIKNFLSSFLLLFGLVAFVTQPVNAAIACPTVMAHRGNAYYGSPVENSLNAFIASYNVGSNWVESDIHFTKDNVPVLMHDSDVSRTTNGTGTIPNLTAEQFSSFTLSDGQHPPTLDQALDLIRDNTSRHMILELKQTLTAAQEQIVINMLQGLESQVYLNAFATRLNDLQTIKAANPSIRTSLLVYAPVLPVPAGIDGEDVEHTYITATRVAQLKAQGAIVRAWTVNNSTSWQTLLNAGVDGILTNKAQAYVKWAQTTCPSTPDPTPTPDPIPDPTPEPTPDPTPVPTTKEFVTNQSIETSTTGWTGMATSVSKNTRIAGGYKDDYALRSVNTSSSAAKHGFSAKPSWIDGTANSTAAGTPYTASAWIKPDDIGQKISIYLRETTPSGTQVGYKTITVTASSTDWQEITNIYTASGSGNALAFHVFSSNSASQKGFMADLLSLSMPI